MNEALPSGEAFEQWLRRLPGFEAAAVRDLQPVDGGASNITCHVSLDTAPVQALALRVQRERGIFEPYDVVREGEVLKFLASSTVPVPAVVGIEPEAAVLGAPFIVLEWVDAPHMGIAGAEADFGAYTEMVARIHALDWRALGLGEVLVVPASMHDATSRELDAIEKRMPGFGCAGDELLGRALRFLRERIPVEGGLCLCQGDINVFNYLFRAKQVAAVVDWERAHIGDPRSDVGQILALVHLRGMPFAPASTMPFAGAYQAASGLSLTQLEYFRALWLFQLGVIYYGWKTFNDSEPWYSLALLEELLEASLAEIA